MYAGLRTLNVVQSRFLHWRAIAELLEAKPTLIQFNFSLCRVANFQPELQRRRTAWLIILLATNPQSGIFRRSCRLHPLQATKLRALLDEKVLALGSVNQLEQDSPLHLIRLGLQRVCTCRQALSFTVYPCVVVVLGLNYIVPWHYVFLRIDQVSALVPLAFGACAGLPAGPFILFGTS